MFGTVRGIVARHAYGIHMIVIVSSLIRMTVALVEWYALPVVCVSVPHTGIIETIAVIWVVDAHTVFPQTTWAQWHSSLNRGFSSCQRKPLIVKKIIEGYRIASQLF